MSFTVNHFNFNVKDLDKSLEFYRKVLGMRIVRQKEAPDGSYKIVFLEDAAGSDFKLELTWLRDHPQSYDLGEQEYHLAFLSEDFEAARQKHREMGIICYENEKMGIYFVEDPDGYWLEFIPKR